MQTVTATRALRPDAQQRAELAQIEMVLRCEECGHAGLHIITLFRQGERVELARCPQCGHKEEI